MTRIREMALVYFISPQNLNFCIIPNDKYPTYFDPLALRSENTTSHSLSERDYGKYG